MIEKEKSRELYLRITGVLLSARRSGAVHSGAVHSGAGQSVVGQTTGVVGNLVVKSWARLLVVRWVGYGIEMI